MKRLSITPKLTLLFILFAAATLVGLSVPTYIKGRQSLRDATISELLSTSLEKQSALNSWVETNEKDIEVVANQTHFRQAVAALVTGDQDTPEYALLESALLVELEDWIGGGLRYSLLEVLDAQTGRVLVSTELDEVGKFKESQPFFVEGRQAPNVQNPTFDLPRQSVTTAAGAPIYSLEGELIAVLGGLLNQQDMNEIIQRRTGLRQTDDAFLVNTSNLFVTQPRLLPDPAVLQRGIHSTAVAACLNRTSGVIEANDYRDVPAIIDYRWLPERQLCLITKINQSEAYAPVNELAATLAYSGGLTLLIGSILALAVSRSITQPVKQLATIAKQFGEGALDQRVDVASRDEIGILGNEFNKMAAALQAETSQLRRQSEQLFKLSLDLICVASLDGYFLLLNPRWVEVFGYSEDEMKNKPFIEFVHPDDRQATIDAMANLSYGIEVNGFENRYRCADESYRWLLWNAASIPEEGLIYATAHDVTEKNDAARRLRESEERYRSLFENMISGYAYCQIILDQEKPCDFIYLEVNNAFETITGLKNVAGKKVSDIIPGIQESNPELFEIYGRVAQTGVPEKFETYVEPLKIWFAVSVYSPGHGYFVAVFDNITEAKLAAEELALSHSQLVHAEQIGHIGSWEWQISGNRVTWSDGLYQILRLEPQEFSATYGSFLAHVHPEDQDYVQRTIENALRDKSAFEYESRFVTHDGQIRALHTRGEVFCDEKGDPIRMAGVAIDITERKRVEEELKLENERFLRFVNANIVGIVIADASGKIHMANDYYLDLLGVSREDFIADRVDWRKYTPPEWLPADEKALQELNEHGICEPYEKEYVRADGSRVPVYLADAMLPGPGEQIAAFVLDISARKQTEEALRTSEQRYRSVFNNAPVSIWREDWTDVINAVRRLQMQGVSNFEQYFAEHPKFVAEALGNVKILDVNEETLRMFRAQAKEEMLASLEVVFSTDDTLPGFVGELVALGEGQLVYRTEMALRTLQKDLIHVLLTMSFPPPDSESGEVLVSLMDITDRKRAEEMVARYTEDLRRSNAELERFAYVASHDLQEPLRMVTSYLQLLERRYKDRLDGDALEFINYAVDGSVRMKTLISDLLAYSRVGTRGKEFTPVDCEVVLTSVLQNLQISIDETGAKITHDPLPQVMADDIQLESLFQNLVGNAIKFRGEDPPEIHIGLRQEGENWIFSVKDNGIGIDPQYFERIFIIFQRLHTRQEYGGTGIGLAISKRIVERHGGRIWIESQPGAGSTFYFTIPVTTGE